MNQKSALNGLSAEQLLDAMSTAVLLVDGKLRIANSNSAAQALLSASATRLHGSALFDSARFPAEFETRLQAARANTPDCIERALTVVIPQAQREIVVDCAVINCRDSAGSPFKLLELTDRGQPARVEREEMRRAQQDASQLLLRELTHEIKNPLGGMRGAAQLLAAELPDPALADYTRIIISEADRLQTLIDRLSGPNSRGAFEAANVHQALERVRDILLSEYGQSATVTCDYDPSIPAVWVDPHWLEQVLLNIAQNAVQAADGSARITFKTRVRRAFTIRKTLHKLVASVEIIDRGPGVPPAIRETLFYPMVSGRDGGSGLGLAIAQGLVVRMGGLIECDSTPGYTTMAVHLPLAESVARRPNRE